MVNAISSTTANARTTPRSVGDITPEQFLKLLITQLQNQDPFEPVKNQDLLAQMSAVRQLQSNLDLSKTLSTFALQQGIGSAGNLIGKLVTGLNGNLDEVRGLVTSLRIEGGQVYLELDTGATLGLKDVTEVAPAPQT